MKPLLSIWLLAAALPGRCNSITLVSDGRSGYHISISPEAGPHERKAATVLAKYLQAASGAQLAVKEEAAPTGKALRIAQRSNLAPESFELAVQGDMIHLSGAGKGALYGTYAFLENFLGCRKWDGGPAYVPRRTTVLIPRDARLHEAPAFAYREIYMPAACTDAEYLDWHRLHRFEDLWGLWGHSFDKLVPARTYFAQHPEYFSLVNGSRKPMQLCLSNEAVLDIAVKKLEALFADNPHAIYWSVSPNDDAGYCECDRCSAVDREEGGPQGSLIRFVNKIAERFPGKMFTTLAYTYTAQPIRKTRPAQNVTVMLSSIEAYRSQPLDREASAAAFRQRLTGWREKTPNVFIWDYCTQFTNYLAIFPNLHTLQPNMQYLRNSRVTGVFEQGSGYTYSDLAELKGYMAARLLWNPDADVQQLKADFLKGYYGAAAPAVNAYLALLEKAAPRQRQLDIYGNPVNEHATFLSPGDMDEYSRRLDEAEAAVEGQPVLAQRVQRLRLGQEYVYLQQARFYGIAQHGIFERQGNGWRVRPGLPERIARFVEACEQAGVKELSEGGATPAAYGQEWKSILAQGVRPNRALHATVQLLTEPAPEFPAKGPQTLTDGNPGYADFSYNWLCFYGRPMEAVIDLGKNVAWEKIGMHFLEDPRHWIFRPSRIEVAVSADGKNFTPLESVTNTLPQEHYNIEKPAYTFTNKGTGSARYLKVRAENWPQLPVWRFRANKKAMIACDEVWVE